jgi:hypothetical protein
VEGAVGKIEVEFEESEWVPVKVTVIKEDFNKEEKGNEEN